jgi:serine/threonine protein kinase
VESNHFWIDGALQLPIGVMKSDDLYHGIVVDATGEGLDGMICVEEHIPPDLFPLPEYISRRGSYTEMDCRFLCKQLAIAIQCMHRYGMAHRNLHMENVLSDIFVSRKLLIIIFGCKTN